MKATAMPSVKAQVLSAVLTVRGPAVEQIRGLDIGSRVWSVLGLQTYIVRSSLLRGL